MPTPRSHRLQNLAHRQPSGCRSQGHGDQGRKYTDVEPCAQGTVAGGCLCFVADWPRRRSDSRKFDERKPTTEGVASGYWSKKPNIGVQGSAQAAWERSMPAPESSEAKTGTMRQPGQSTAAALYLKERTVIYFQTNKPRMPR